jgi:hypothetical protein
VASQAAITNALSGGSVASISSVASIAGWAEAWNESV